MKSLHIITGLAIVLSVIIGASLASAQADPFDQLTYPIPELGNCENRDACELYCQDLGNMEDCLDYAESHNLMPASDIEMGRQMLVLGQTGGPGNCRGQFECQAYCNDINNLEECINFAIEHEMMPPEELEEAQMVLSAIQQGVAPPPCGGRDECDIYCSQPENMRVCMEFAIAAGLMPPEELEEAQMVLSAIERGVNPPACGSKASCDIYCSEPEHFEECIAFAEAAGFMSAEEAEMVRRTGGQGPGGCQGQAECDAFCNDPNHMLECIEFALEYDLMPPEEVARARKMLELGIVGGPGGCMSDEECNAFCENPANMQECINFAVQMGEMSPEQAQEAQRMIDAGLTGGPGGCMSDEECNAFCENPANMNECIDFAVQIGEMTLEEAEQARQGMQGGAPMNTPGGCMSEEECMVYCQDPAHMEECIWFSVEMGEMSHEEAQGIIEMMRMQEQMMPVEETGPQSLLDLVNHFLASLIVVVE